MSEARKLEPVRRPLRERVSAEEWQVRVDLAACYRLVAHYGMTDMIYTHITARVPGPEHHFLINPYGLLFDEINASSLVKIDLDGKVVLQPDHDFPINHAGFVIHSAVHAARANAHCVIHTHTRAGMAVSAQKCGLLPLTQTAMRFYGELAYHDYEGPALDLGERERLVADLGAHRAMILRNHGLLACGPTVAEAFNTIYWLERACQAQVDALAGGLELNLPPAEVAAKTAHLYRPEVRRPWGRLEWPTMLRMLDRRDPTYRE
ncbi:MAG TPA: class II aldolase/adducin family protein [Stellaceae bacterium]|nr:class II aldolase/adducin family protein [Stellaceae bacterium]